METRRIKGRQKGPWPLALLTIAMLMATGCSSSHDDEIGAMVADEEGTIQLIFNIVMKENKATRSDTWASYTQSDELLDYENQIYDLEVALYDEDNVLVGVVKQQSLTGSTGNYQYTGKVQLSSNYSNSGTFQGKIVVMANCEDILSSSDYSFSSIGEATFSMTDCEDGGKLSQGIPMWGVKTIEMSLGSITSIDLGQVDLLRAMARIELSLDEETKERGYTFTEATLSKYNSTGYVVPEGYSSATETSSISLECINIPTSVVATEESLSFTKYNESDTLMIAYVPEIDNSDGSAHIDLKIQRTDEDGTTYLTKRLQFNTYQDGEPQDGTEFSLIRNHTYRYSLHKTDESKIYVTSEVSEWESVTSTVAWNASTVTLAPKSNSKEGDEEALYSIVSYPRWDGDEHKDTMWSKSYATYEFTVSPPDDGGRITWKAYLSNKYFAFNTNNSESDKPNNYCVTTGVSRDDPYYVKVGPVLFWEEPADPTETIQNAGYVIGGWDDIPDTCKIEVEDDDIKVALYADMFVIATKSDGSYEPLDINPTYSGYFTPNRYPGGTLTITHKTADGTFTLGEHQWIRIYQAEAVIDTNNQYKDVASFISGNSPVGCQWWSGSSSSKQYYRRP